MDCDFKPGDEVVCVEPVGFLTKGGVYVIDAVVPAGGRTPIGSITMLPAVSVEGEVIGAIGAGLLILLCAEHGDTAEDARYIARRLVVLASEDIGMADSFSLVVADAAARAVEFVGLPEAQLNLAHAVVHLATAPKSNRVTVALGRAQSDVRERAGGEVPNHLRDGHYKGAKSLGHGQGYDYPHDSPEGWVDQQYRPSELEGRVYYDPSPHGHEDEVRKRMQDNRRNHNEDGT